MFTGLVEQVGTIARRGGGSLAVRPAVALPDPVIGESIAVNGCCLTLERYSGGLLEFHTLEESLGRTNLARLPLGAPVNLERALRIGDRLGGHFVQGHVDDAVTLRRRERMPDGDLELDFELPGELAPEVIRKGSVALDGVSLTVVALGADFFTVRLIPQTLKDTALPARPVGGAVNLETDLIGKHLRRWYELAAGNADAADGTDSGAGSGITYERLREAGFL